MKAVFAVETVAACRSSGIEPLIRAHWREVAVHQDEVPLDVNWAQYEEMERLGRLFILTMRVNENLVGYNIFFVMAHMHYSKTIHALNDIVYVAPHQRGLDGVRLILEAEKHLEKLSARKIIYHSKSDSLLGAQRAGEGYEDSLDRMDDLVALEGEYNLTLPDSVMAHDGTLGDVLQRLGYKSIETIYAKLME